MVTKSKLIQHLKDEGQYTLASEILINLLYDNLSKLKQINKLLKDEGLTVSGNGDGTFFIRNNHIKTYNEINDNILKYSKALAINLQQVEKKIKEEKVKDEFEMHQDD